MSEPPGQQGPPVRVGLDLLPLGDLDRLASRPWFVRFIFAEREIAQADTMAGSRRREFLAGRFAAKEAVLKVLGKGFFQGVMPRDIVLVRGPSGAPTVELVSTARDAAAVAGVSQIGISITHSQDLAAAVAAGW
jgi:holo-[acyl-carrier protein] synthase